MLNINYEFRKGIFFLRLMGDLTNQSLLSKEKEINSLINQFKYIVININYIKSIDIYGINYLLKISSIIMNNKCKLVICDKTKLTKKLLTLSIPNIDSEIEVL